MRGGGHRSSWTIARGSWHWSNQIVTLIEIVRIDVPCPKCRKISKRFLREMIANDTVPCTYCGDVIDISSKEWRARIREAEETYGQFKAPPTI